MPKTAKRILSTFSIIIVALLLMPVFITRTAASDADDLLSVYPYWVWDPAEQVLAISKTKPSEGTLNDSNYPYIEDPYTNAKYRTGARYYYFIGSTDSINNCIILRYISTIDSWDISLPYLATPSLTKYQIMVGFPSSDAAANVTKKQIYTNGYTISHMSGYTKVFNVTTSLPSDIPEINIGLPDIDTAINNALNATTSVTTQALTINQNINNTYNTYQSGGITQAEFNAQMEQYRNQLESLTDSTGATLADQMAVNNALTNLDITINQQVNNVSPNLLTLIESIRSSISTAFNRYTMGDWDQSYSIEQIKKYINDNLLKQTNQYTSIADREAINGTIEYANSIINSIGSYSDLEQDISDAAESSDKAEKDYLDSLTSETTASIQDISPKDSFSDAEMGTAQEVLSIIWENKLVKRLLIICGCFMVVCVVLGIRYKV